MFRELSEEEKVAFRKWARDNFRPGGVISELWHPVVIEECLKIIEESKMKDRKEISIGEVFTEEMIEEAMKCKDASEIQKRVIDPNMDHINKVTGQANDPRYWAYALQFALNQLNYKKPTQH